MITRAKSKLDKSNNAKNWQQGKEQCYQAEHQEQFCIFEGDACMDIEGLRYSAIDKNKFQKQYLQSLRSNLPTYSKISNKQKPSYFKKLSSNYHTSLTSHNPATYNSQSDNNQIQMNSINIHEQGLGQNKKNKSLMIQKNGIQNQNDGKELKNVRKHVSFQVQEKFVVFDKRDKPRQVRFLGEQLADTKF